MTASIFTFTFRPALPCAADPARRVKLTLQQWIVRRRTRRQLAQLDDRLLRDAGISHAQMWQECGAKPQPPPAEQALRTLTWR